MTNKAQTPSPWVDTSSLKQTGDHYVHGRPARGVHGAGAKTPYIRCPGDNTFEMRYCAGKPWEQSERQLRQKVSKQQFNQWQDATRQMCAKAYGPYKNGTIYPQFVVAWDDNLNRALLKEFQSVGN